MNKPSLLYDGIPRTVEDDTIIEKTWTATS